MKYSATLLCITFLSAVSEGQALFKDPAEFDSDHPPLMMEVSIPSGGELLTGTYYVATGPGPHPTIVSLHAFPGYEKNLDLAQALRRAGYNVLYFDYRGVWGGPSEFSVATGYEDAANAMQFVRDPANARSLRIDTDHITLLGHSFGAVAALDVGSRDDDLRCIVSLAPEDMTIMIGTDEDRDSLARYTDNLRVVEGYPGAKLIEDLIENQDDWAMTTTVQSLGDTPYLIIGGALDSNFGAADVADVVAAGEKAGASSITPDVIDYADHSFSARRIELIEKVAVWLNANCR